MASDRQFLVQPLALRTQAVASQSPRVASAGLAFKAFRRRCAKRERCIGRHASFGEKPSRRRQERGLPAPTPCCFSPRARALTTSIVTFGARRPHWREVVLSSSCASERVRRSPQCGGSRDCQSPLQWRRVLPCLVKLPEQGVCVGLLLPPLDAAHAEMQQLGAVWGCWMWCARHLAV